MDNEKGWLYPHEKIREAEQEKAELIGELFVLKLLLLIVAIVGTLSIMYW